MRPGTVWLFPHGRVTLKGPGEWEGHPKGGTPRIFKTFGDACKYIKPIMS